MFMDALKESEIQVDKEKIFNRGGSEAMINNLDQNFLNAK